MIKTVIFRLGTKQNNIKIIEANSSCNEKDLISEKKKLIDSGGAGL